MIRSRLPLRCRRAIERALRFSPDVSPMSETFTIGVDLGGTNLRIASYADEVGLMDTIEMPTQLAEGRDRVVRDIRDAVLSFVDRGYGDRRLAGVGVGTPGPLELPGGVLRNPPNLPGWDGFDLRNALESSLDRSIEIESDANLAALAEVCLGAGRSHNVDSLCMLTLGTGVGNGLIFNRKIWHGANGMGGEAGHIIVQDVDGVPCGCGGFGCLEQYASATAVVRMAEERFAHEASVDAHDLYVLAQAGDDVANSVFQSLGHSLAIALTALVNTLNLPLYLIGGGVCEAWELFAPTMFQELHRRSYVYRLTSPDDPYSAALEKGKTNILRAELSSAAGLLGACLLPYHALSPNAVIEASSSYDTKTTLAGECA
jgi:glucokinase